MSARRGALRIAAPAVDEAEALLVALDGARRRAGDQSTAALRAVRRALSRQLRQAPRGQVLALAHCLIARDGRGDRFLAYEIVAAHPATMAGLTRSEARRLGRGLSDWSGVDCFACYVAGPAWRMGRLSDRELDGWARSRDRWWRRAAVVSTVALNTRARGGAGDAARTLRVAARVTADRDPTVVKALSWALRELGKRDARAVRAFLAVHGSTLAALVRREVANKLDTGLKRPRRPPRRA